MPLLYTAVRRCRPSRPRAEPPVTVSTNATLEFSGAVTDSDSGVFGVVATTNANITFSFLAVTPRVGVPRDLEISESGVLKLVVTFTSDYDGQSYVYRDSSGTSHNGTFPSGNGTVNY